MSLYLSKVNSEISTHFNQYKHNLKDDFKYIIFKENIYDDSFRLSCENDLIHILLSLKFKVINSLIPNQNYIKRISFY